MNKMKYVFFCLLFIILACKSVKTDLPLLQNCPESGQCDVQVLKETKLIIQENEGKVTGLSYEPDSDFQVISIRYTALDQNNYSEIIYLQIPSTFKEIQSKNHSLQNQKLIVNKQCDCATSGYVKIMKGQLELINFEDYISLHLEIEPKDDYVVKIVDLDI